MCKLMLSLGLGSELEISEEISEEEKWGILCWVREGWMDEWVIMDG